ncbi:unnamed protein product, partial [Discosporangium mesarthrocarpum]
ERQRVGWRVIFKLGRSGGHCSADLITSGKAMGWVNRRCRKSYALARAVVAAVLLGSLSTPETLAKGVMERVPFTYTVMIDAGSSGCRLNIHRVHWEGPTIRVSGSSGGKIEPGLSSFAETPAQAVEHLRPLMATAEELIPREYHSSTKVYIKSTAGMRLLAKKAQEAIYSSIYDSLASDESFPFHLDRHHLGTIDGDMEAFYGALSANYLAGRINARLRTTGHGGGEIGALDMGGASTQIIFRHGRG